jgi:hypothetical protein
MSQTITGIVVDGELRLDRPLTLPNQTAVSVTIQPVASERTDAIAAWESLQARLAERPIHGGGKRFSRDELYEGR